MDTVKAVTDTASIAYDVFHSLESLASASLIKEHGALHRK
jgi:hypothetical protein